MRKNNFFHGKGRRQLKLTCFTTFTFLAAWVSLPQAMAVPLSWDTISGDSAVIGGLGTWNLSNSNWTSDAGLSNQAWVNNPTTPDDAIFGGTGGVVTLGTGINVGNITFSAAGYTLAGNTLTFGGITPTITSTGVFGAISSSVAGTAGLKFDATGTAGTYLDGNNSYSGVTTVNTGFLIARNAGSLGSAVDGTVVTSGATLQIENGGAGDVNIANEAVTISGTGALGNRGALASWAGNNTWGGTVTMAADSSIFVQAGNLQVNGVVGGGFNLSKTGAGQLTLGGTATNTYSGTTTVDLGTMVLGKTGGAFAISGPVTMGGVNTNQPNLRMTANNQFAPGVVVTFVNATSNWARFDLQGTNQTLAGIQCTTGGGIIQNERLNGGGTYGPATLTINNSADYSFTGYMRDRDGGAGLWLLNIVKTGAGKQTIGGPNVNYTGTTTVSQGTLSLLQTTAYNSPTTVAAGATLELGGTADLQNNQIGSTIALAGNLNRITNAGWLVWNGKVSPTAATATLNLKNDGANPGAGVGWIFLDGGLGSTGSQTLTINHVASDGTTPNNNLATVLRNNNSTYTGSIAVNNGSLVIAGGAAMGTQLANTDVTLNNATLQFAAVFASGQNTANQLKSVVGSGTVSLGGSALNIGFNNGSGAFGGSITGTGSLVKVGNGTITLAGVNSFTGATTLNSGILKLDYATQDNSKLSDTSALNLGGGTLELSGGTHPEIVLSTSLAAGTATTITRTSGGAVLQLNTITRGAGASVNFTAPGIATTDSLNVGGILGTWATVGSDWAMNSTNAADGAITAYTGYTAANRLGGSIADGIADNVKIIEAGASGNVTLASAGTTTINTLLQGAAGGAAVVDLGTGNTLRLGAAGGIFLPSSNPALTLNNGTLTAGGTLDTAGVIELNNASTTGAITVNSTIANNGLGVVSLSKVGTGEAVLTGTNGFTGGSTISGGTLAFNAGSLGTTGTISIAGGILRWNGTNTEDISGRAAFVNASSATFDTNGNNVTFANAIGGATSTSIDKAGNGTLTLSAANTHTGVTTVKGGTLALNNVNALQSSTLDTGVSGSQTTTFAVAGTNTYNLGGLQGVDALDLGGNTISVGAGNTITNYSGVLSGAGGSLTKVGTGALTLSGSASNTYSGSTTIASNGQLILSKTGGAVAIPGDLIMAAPAVRGIVSTTEDNQFAPGSVLRFTSAGDTRLELKGTTQTLGGIENSAVVTKTYHAIQHSEFGLPVAVDTTSQLILNVTGANSFTFNTTNGAIRDFNGGVMSLVKNGTGTQTFIGTGITYTGPTAVNAGTLVLNGTSGYASPTTIGNGATVNLTNSANQVIGSGGQFYLSNGGVLTHSGLTDGGDYIVLNGAITVSGSGTINQNSVTNTTGINKNLFVDAGLHGSGTLTINAANPGNAVVFRNNNSTFAGTIIVNGIPSAVVNAGSGIAVPGNTVSMQNTDFTVNGTMELLAQGLGWAGTASGDFALGALNGTGVLVGNHTGNGETRLKMGYTNANGNFSGTIVDGNGNRIVLTKLGTGTQILSGNNTYSGSTTISGGTLQIGNGGTSGSIGNGAVVNNGSLVVNRSNDVTINGAISGTGNFTKSGAGVTTVTGNSTYQGSTTINGGTLRLGASQTMPVSSAIWLDATDGSTINTSGGGVTLWTNKGTLGASGDVTAPIGQEPSLAFEPTMNNNQVIRFDSTAGGGAPFDRLTNAINFSAGNVTVMYVGRLNGGDSNLRLVGGLANNWLLGTWNGNSERAYFGTNWVHQGVGLDTNARVYTGTIATGGLANFYVNSAQLGSGTGMQGPNGLILGGGFNATENSDGDIGEMLVFNSVLTAEERGQVEAYLRRKWQGGNTNVLPATTAVTMPNSGTTLDLNGVTQTVASTTGAAGTNITLNGGKLTTGDALSTTYAGNITGTGEVTKVGSGTWTLSGSNNIDGKLSINAGTLSVTGSTEVVELEVNAGAIFKGTGSVLSPGGIVTFKTGSILSPGTSPGTLSFNLGGGTLDLAPAVTPVGSASLMFELGSPGTDVVSLTNTTLSIGTSVLDFSDFNFSAISGFGPGIYTLFDGSSPIVGSLGSNVTGSVGGLSSTLSTANGNQDLILTVVPEPSSLAILGLGSLALARRRRRTISA